MVDVDVHISSHLKEELAWAVHILVLRCYLKNSKRKKELKPFNFKKILYALLYGP